MVISSKKYAKYTFGTFPKSNRKIVERGKFDNPNAHFTFFIQHYNKKYKHLNEWSYNVYISDSRGRG